ncbi:MAG: HXXEE domain-containing protein [Candidatus Aminicenantes bacterium]|nr:HXXEE domain-containing protein [Candidatus Aminicenantes bacterium]
MGDWIFTAVLGAAVFHIVEEYVYPGGFPEGLQNLLPRATHLFTSRFHLIVNGLFLLLCLLSIFIGTSNLVLSLSVFSLIFVNAVLHIRGTIVTKRYYPGVVSGTLIYIPLAIYAYSMFLLSG